MDKWSDAHKFFAANCFNQTWELLDKKERTTEDERLMLSAAHASLYHWLNRKDCVPENLSVGLWQLSRVHAVLNDSDISERYAKECIEISEAEKLPPFYIGYGYEAAARAAKLQGATNEFSRWLQKAEAQLEQVEDEADRGYLAADLDELRTT